MPVAFRYHPEPTSTGSLVSGDGSTCDVCGRAATLVYRGPIYSLRADEPTICDECIASGRAADEWDAAFTDLGGDEWDDVSHEVKDEVLRRTAGFTGWQQPQWQAHCSDAMVFLGPAGHEDLESFGPDAVASMRAELASWGWDQSEADDFVQTLSREGMPTAYVFRCRHCPEFRVYADFA